MEYRRMRSKKLFALVLAVAASAAGCNQDPQALFVDLRWHVVCTGSGGNCVPPGPDSREVLGEDGHTNTLDPDGANVDVYCKAVRGDNYTAFQLSVDQDDYAIDLSNVLVPNEGGANLASACRVDILDQTSQNGSPGDLTLEGSCSAETTDDPPCDVSAEITRIDGDPTVTFSLSCSDIPSVSDASTYRDVVHGGDITPNAPAELQVRNCPGL